MRNLLPAIGQAALHQGGSRNRRTFMVVSEAARADWLRRIRAEYIELPGMKLTESQVKRLWGLDTGTCRTLLDELVRSGFLKQTRTHRYVRASSY
jgi:hypothetical protein